MCIFSKAFHIQWTDDDKKLEDIISSYRVNFAATGNPNGAGLPQWDAYDAGKDAVMVLNADEQSTKPISAKAEFDFLDKYQAVLRKNK